MAAAAAPLELKRYPEGVTNDPQPYVYPDGYRTVAVEDGWKGVPEFKPRAGYLVELTEQV